MEGEIEREWCKQTALGWKNMFKSKSLLRGLFTGALTYKIQ